MKNKNLIFLFLFLIIATSFESFYLTKISLWHDEAFSALLIHYDLKEMLYRISLDVHPPLYYLLLKGWAVLFGGSLFSIRFFSLFFGILTIFALYVFIKKSFQNEKLAVFTTILLTLSSFQIQYNMEARMYTLSAFFIVISTFFLMKALETKKIKFWLFYAISASAAIYSHYYTVFWIMAQAVYLTYWIFRETKFNIISWFKNKDFQFGLGSFGLITVSFLPWITIFLKQLNRVQASYWIPPMNIWSIPNTFLSLTTGGSTDPVRFWWVLVILMVLVISTTVYFLIKIQSPIKWLIFLLVFFPFLFSTLLSFKTSIYLDRYFIFTLPFYLILIAAAIFSLENKIIRNAFIVIAILGSLVSFPSRWISFEIEKKPGMAAAANFLNQEVDNNKDKIFVGSSFVYFTFKYYNQTEVHPLLFVPGELPHFSGTALLSPEDTFADFNQETKKGDVAWMINTTGFGNYQPSLPKNWLKIEEKGFQDTYDYRGWIIVDKYQVQ